MIGKLITGFAWRHEHAIYFSWSQWVGQFFWKPPNIRKFMSEFSSSHQFIFHIIFEYRSFFCQQKLVKFEIHDAYRMRLEAPIYQNFLGGGPPNPPYEKGKTPSRALPLSCLQHSILFSPDHFLEHGYSPAAEGMRASQGTFSSLEKEVKLLYILVHGTRKISCILQEL